MIKRTLIFTSMTLLLTGCLSIPGIQKPSTTQPVEISPQHIEMVRALNSEELSKLAERGDQFAQYYLGNKYAQGAEVPQDMTKAKAYWEQSANQGNGNALYNLGMSYFTGQGSTKSFETALNYFQRSAEAGNTRAALNAGSMLEQGQGAMVNLPLAAQFYQRAVANQPHAAYRLGLLYTKNTADFPADYNQAAQLFQQAATQGDRFAPRALNIIQNYPAEQAADLLTRLSNSI